MKDNQDTTNRIPERSPIQPRIDHMLLHRFSGCARKLLGAAAVVCLLTGFSYGQNAEEEELQNDPLNAVVRIESVFSIPNYGLPWQNGVPQSGSGSGVVVNGKQILTNAHNIADSTMITIRKQNEDTLFNAKVKFVDHDCDLALLTVDDPEFFKDITPLKLAETPPPQSQVIVAGFPMGGTGISLTQGIISRIEVIPYSHSNAYLLAAQIDAAINPGNSGGPVFYDGNVVGIAFQSLGGGENIGSMIPYEIIQHFFKDIKDGKVDGFGDLGLATIPLENPDTRAYLKMKTGQTGLLIYKVFEEEKKNDVLRVGDVLLSIDGHKIANNGNIRLPDGQPRSFSTISDAKQIGENVKLELLRDGELMTVELPVRKIALQADPYLYDRRPEYFIIGGFVFTRLTRGYLRIFGKSTPPMGILEKVIEEKEKPDDNVVILDQVLPDKVNVGYEFLDSKVLVSINGKEVHNLREAVEMVENCKDEYITFLFDGDVPVTLNIKKLREATPRILNSYRIPVDRYLE